jgi:hypothetical protein
MRGADFSRRKKENVGNKVNDLKTTLREKHPPADIPG